MPQPRSHWPRVLAVSASAVLAAAPATAAHADSTGNTAPTWPAFALSRVSLAVDGSQALGHSFFASISGTGRYVAYRTNALNAGGPQTVVRDVVTGHTSPVILRPDGGPSQATEIIRTSVSADGRYVAFCSMAGDLVPGTVPFRAIRVFVRDTRTGTTTLASVDSKGAEFPSDAAPGILSGDGRSVAFTSAGRVYVRHLDTATTVEASIAPPGEDWRWGAASGFPSLSADGRSVAFTHQDGGQPAVYVRDLVASVTTRASVTTTGDPAMGSQPSLSPDGRYVAFVSSAPKVTPGTVTSDQVYRRDLLLRKTVRVSVTPAGAAANAESSDPSIAAGGRYVVFASGASDLVPGDTNYDRDIFVRDVQAGTTVRINVAPNGSQANSATGWAQPLISADGTSVVFSSLASNLVPGDTNGFEDVFVASAR
jgi:Tol biopolymer transport system component